MNTRGFTLIEMTVVMFIISVLMILTLPNIVKQKESIEKKGCEAFVQTVTMQIQAYELEKGTLPATIDDLLNEGYITTTQCTNGVNVEIQNGKAQIQS